MGRVRRWRARAALIAPAGSLHGRRETRRTHGLRPGFPASRGTTERSPSTPDPVSPPTLAGVPVVPVVKHFEYLPALKALFKNKSDLKTPKDLSAQPQEENASLKAAGGEGSNRADMRKQNPKDH